MQTRATYWGVIGLALSKFDYKAQKGVGAWMVDVEIPDEQIKSWDDSDWEDEYEFFCKILASDFPEIDYKKSFLPQKQSIMSSLMNQT